MSSTTYGIKAGKAFVLIEAVDMTSRVLDSIRHKIGRFGSDISALGQTLAFRSAAALTPVAMSLGTFAKFDDSLRIVEARSKGTAEEMDGLRAQAQKLGATTAFTATHIGQLMARLAQAKKTRKEIGEMSEPIMNLARAGAGPAGNLEEDIINAADATTQVMAAYRMETSETSKITDLLAATVNNSRFSLEELNTALQYGAAAGKAYNVPLEDTLTALAAIRDLGYDASIAGTAFRNMMQHTVQAKERDDFNEALKSMTGNTVAFTNAAGDLVNPLDMLVALMKATEGLGTAARGDLLTNLFESRATTPAMGVGAATENIAKMRKVLSESGGTAKRVHDAMEKGMGGAFRRIASAIENVAIEIGYALNPTIVNLGLILEASIHHITDWMQAYRGWIGIVVASILGIGALGIGLIALGQSLRMLSGLLILVSVPMQLFAFLFTPGGALIAGIILAATLIPGLSKAVGEMAVSFASSMAILLTSWKTTLDAIAQSLAAGDLNGAFTMLASQVELTWKTMLDHLMTAWEGFKSGIAIPNVFLDATIAARERDLAALNKKMATEGFTMELEAQRQGLIDSLKGLRGQRDAPLEEVAGPHIARQQELKDLEEKLRLLKVIQAAEALEAGELGSSSSSTAVPEFSAEMSKLMEDARKLIMPGAAAVESLDRKPITGAEGGTVEGAIRAQENRFAALGTGITKLVHEAIVSNRTLSDIDTRLAEMVEANTSFSV